MLFKYTYVNDDAEKLQELVRHIVIDVWCEASGPFSIDLIDDTIFTCLAGGTDSIRKKVNRTAANLKTPIEEIYNICLTFSTVKKDYIKDAFEKNNNIEGICNNTITPVFYDELKNNTSEAFSNKIKSFFKTLYENVFGGKPYYINKHYDSFMINNKHLCPTCGLNPLEADSSNHREDYDHYFPKEKYPFNTVNLKNLMPICGVCNKNWKKTKNPVQYINFQQKAFYYYGTVDPDIEITVHIIDMETCNVEVLLTSTTMQKEVDTWNRVYSIGKRYKENVICHKQIGKGWLRKAKADLDRNPAYNIDDDIYDAKTYRLENKNFIRASFLEECKNKGLLFDEQNILLNMLQNIQ